MISKTIRDAFVNNTGVTETSMRVSGVFFNIFLSKDRLTLSYYIVFKLQNER